MARGLARATSSRSARRSSSSARHAGPHDEPRLPALAHRPAGALLRRHAVQRRRRQLPQRRPSGELYETFSEQLAKLPDDTLIYPGHDYIENNLRFTLSREPDNRGRRDARQPKGADPSRAYVSTLAVEREINTFFRLTSPSVIARLREAFPDLPEKPDPRTVFLKLRELQELVVALPPLRRPSTGSCTLARRKMVPEHAEHRRRVAWWEFCFSHAAHHHAQVARLDHHADALGVERLHDHLRDLVGEALLDLQAAR